MLYNNIRELIDDIGLCIVHKLLFRRGGMYLGVPAGCNNKMHEITFSPRELWWSSACPSFQAWLLAPLLAESCRVDS